MVLFCNLGFADPAPKTKINIILKEQSNPVALSRDASWLPSKAARRDYVVKTLKSQAEASQQDLIALLNEMEQNGLVSEIRPLWIVNSISCYATQEALISLQDRLDIMTIYPCEPTPYLFDEPTSPAARGDGREIAENLLKVNANIVWEQGYRGQGVLVGLM